jgi:hypothetical protein
MCRGIPSRTQVSLPRWGVRLPGLGFDDSSADPLSPGDSRSSPLSPIGRSADIANADRRFSTALDQRTVRRSPSGEASRHAVGIRAAAEL